MRSRIRRASERVPIRRAKGADRFGRPSECPERDAEPAVRAREMRLEFECSAKIVERVEFGSLLDEQVADVRQRSRAAGVHGEGLGERGTGGNAVAAADLRDAPLVLRRGAFAWSARIGGGPGERCDCLGVATGPKRDEACGIRRARVRTPGEGATRREHVPAMLRVDVLTLFPELFAPAIALSILGRAHERGLVAIELHHVLDALGGAERADDRPFGGGPGMVMRLAPLARILDPLLAAAPGDERRAIVVTSAAGEPLRHALAAGFAMLDRLVLICGHYEGIDERLVELYEAREISLGDFVLTGGEIPALAILDATVRLVPGAITAESLASESFAAGTLDAPAYTRPANFRGLDVPAVLLSGDHAAIAEWRREQSRERTRSRRADLLDD